jgi:UDP-GlcNAc:undecaprenyl-phosphate GlcNAc-1-phosphate transferase
MLGVALAALGVSFTISLLGTAAVRALARRLGYVDRPGGHKQHAAPVALGGGVAIVVALLVPTVTGCLIARSLASGPLPAWLPEALHPHVSGAAESTLRLLGVLAAVAFMHIVGLVDDRRALGPWIKFALQFAAAAFVAVVLDIRLLTLLGTPLSIAVTMLWIVLITNAFNFLDNMDGLSAGVGAICAIIFAMAAFNAGQVFVPMLALATAGALCGYLVFNFHPATIFMGDAGSLPTGFMIGVLTVMTTFHDPGQGLSPLGVLVPIVALAVPLYDVTSVVIHRLRLGENPLRGDRRHFSHRLMRRGMSVRKAVLTIYLATAATGLPAIVLPRVDWTSGVLLLAQCICVVLIIAILEHTGPSTVD